MRFKSYPRVSQILLFCTSPGVRPYISQINRPKKVEMNDFWTISHSCQCLICKIVEMKISEKKKWHLRLSIDFLFVKRCPPFHTWMCSMDRRQKDKQHWNDLQMQQWVYWVYLVPMVLRKHTLYNIRYLSFEWICIYTNILWYELIKK